MKFTKKYLLNIVIILLFIILQFIILPKHEYWPDEVQSFMIARDSSISEIFEYIKYEGTPPLWVLIIHFAIKLGLRISNFYILSLLFSVIGISIILFKIEMPWYIKILFPFSFYIFYQGTVICRSYSLILPILALLYIFYKDRFKKPLIFTFLLFLFMNISLHTYFLAGALYAIYLYDFYKNYKSFIQDKEYNSKKILISCILIFLFLLAILIIIFPNSNSGFGVFASKVSFFEILGMSTIASGKYIIYSYIAGILVFLLIIYSLVISKNIEFSVKGIIKYSSLFFIYLCINFVDHHLIILFDLFLFMSLENINKNKIHKVSFLIICIVQIFFTYNSIMFDYYNDYNGTNKLVSFLDEINFDYENETLSGLLYHVVGIQSKFDKNIFANYGKNSDKAFYKWTIDRDYDETTNNSYDAYVMTAMGKDTEDSIHLTSSTTKNVVKELIYKNYVCYKFNGYVYSKNMIKEINSYLLFLSPQINSRVDNSKYTPFEIPKSYFNY